MLPKLDFFRLAASARPVLQAPSATANTTTVAQAQEQWHRYGEDNLYPQHLISFRHYSPTHAAILRLKADLLAGEGFLNLPAGQQLLSPTMLNHLATDLAIFGGWALAVTWSRDGKQIAVLEPINFAELRRAKQDMAKAGKLTQPPGFYRCADWQGWMANRNQALAPVFLPAFDPALAQQYSRQVWYHAQYSPEATHYPVAPYHAALPDVVWDYEYSRFKTAHIQNGMFPALHVQVEAEPSEDERLHFQRELKRKFGGSSQAGEVLITYGFEGSGRTQIKPIEVHGNADLFAAWAADATQRIISAHRLSSPILAGLPGQGGLGGRSNEIAVAFEHFFNTVIRPQQLQLLHDLVQLLQFSTLSNDQQAMQLDIANSKPIRLVFGEALLQQVLTKDELRAELGYEVADSPANNPSAPRTV